MTGVIDSVGECEAARAAAAVASSGPSLEAALLRLGRACVALSQYPEASWAFEQASTAADPRLRVAALHELGGIRRAEGRYDEARQILGRALALAEGPWVWRRWRRRR